MRLKTPVQSTLYSFKPEGNRSSVFSISEYEPPRQEESVVDVPKYDSNLTPTLANLIRFISLDTATLGKSKNPSVIDMNKLAELGTLSPHEDRESQKRTENYRAILQASTVASPSEKVQNNVLIPRSLLKQQRRNASARNSMGLNVGPQSECLHVK